MPVVLNKAGYKVKIWTDDHDPPHVHVFKQGAQIKIKILGTPEIVDISKNCLKNVIRGALDLVCENQEYLIKKWGEIHG